MDTFSLSNKTEFQLKGKQETVCQKTTKFSTEFLDNSEIKTPKLDLKPLKGILKNEKSKKKKLTLKDLEKQGF